MLMTTNEMEFLCKFLIIKTKNGIIIKWKNEKMKKIWIDFAQAKEFKQTIKENIEIKQTTE
jgi:hypothetical protein